MSFYLTTIFDIYSTSLHGCIIIHLYCGNAMGIISCIINYVRMIVVLLVSLYSLMTLCFNVHKYLTIKFCQKTILDVLVHCCNKKFPILVNNLIIMFKSSSSEF